MKETVRNMPRSIIFRQEKVIVIVFDFGMSIAESIFFGFLMYWIGMFYYLFYGLVIGIGKLIC